MHVFVTGSSGHIGRAVLAELTAASHDVVGLVRSDRGAEIVASLGATALVGDVNDAPLVASAAREADAIVHLAYDNAAVATGDLQSPADADVAVVRALGSALAGTGKAVIGIGIGVGPTGDAERDRILAANPRHVVAREVIGLGERGIRDVLVAIPPVTHSEEDRTGFIPTVIATARAKGAAGYIGDGANTWPAVHTLDLATLFRLAVEQAPAGSQLMGAAEPGVPVRAIAEVVARHLGLPTMSIPADAAAAFFAPFPFMGLSLRLPNDATRELLGWTPTHATLIEDLEAGHYFRER